MASEPIGLFDSGIGGLSIMKEIRRLLPEEDLIYVADSKYCPYGEKTSEEIIERSISITKFLISKGVKLIVVACNTASIAALQILRDNFDLPFVGVEPAVKQAALHTKDKKVGVLATELTLTGERFSSLVEKFAGGLNVTNQPCPGLVEKVEAGEIAGNETEALVKEYIKPLKANGVDVVVLGCTHYPFLRPIVEKFVGTGVKVIDTGEPVARQTRRLLAESSLLASKPEGGKEWFYTSGDPKLVAPVISKLWGNLGEGIAQISV